jgi:plastocyanin
MPMMTPMRGRGRRFWLGVAGAAAMAAIIAGTAWAATTTITSSALTNTYQQSKYNLVHPDTLNFKAQGTTHTVTASGKVSGTTTPLFNSGFVSPNVTKFVAGSQYLAPGTYNFFCQIHPSTMSGTLNVTGPPKTRPVVHVRILSTSLSTVRTKGKLRVRARRNVTGPVFLKATGAGTTLGTKTVTVTGGIPLDTGIPLTDAGKNAIKNKSSVTVTLKGTPKNRYGIPATRTKTLS